MSEQREIVSASLGSDVSHGMGQRRRIRREPVHRYEMQVTRLDAVPRLDDIVETRAGVYWSVLEVEMVTLEGALVGARLMLEPIKSHSVEAHACVRYARGGVLSLL